MGKNGVRGNKTQNMGGEYDVDWDRVGVLADSFHGDRMTQCMANGKTVTL